MSHVFLKEKEGYTGMFLYVIYVQQQTYEQRKRVKLKYTIKYYHFPHACFWSRIIKTKHRCRPS